MSDTKFVAHCLDCGHAYKVPSETKVYPCKECGGDVCAANEEPDEPDEEEVLEEEEEPWAPEERSIRSRHTRAPKSKIPMIVGAVVVVLGIVGALGYAQGWFGFLTGAEPDFDKVTASFVEDWNAGDVDALVEYYHPDAKEEFRAKLTAVQTNRGWDFFPEIIKHANRLTKGTEEAPESKAIILGFVQGAEEAQWANMDFQFAAGQGRWYMYNFDIIPSSLAPRAEAFREAWAGSDAENLRPFFKPGSADKMVALFVKQGTRHGWLDSFPVLGEPKITGEESARMPNPFGAGKIYSEFASPDGPLSVNWIWNKGEDIWYLQGIKLVPKR